MSASSQRQRAATSAAVAGKTARSCDGCARRRARWYCAADDAFLCQSCDGLVHAANPLSRRHERVRLKGSPSNILRKLDAAAPLWLKRKARTPRSSNNGKPLLQQAVLPELDMSVEEHGTPEEQLIYGVPVLDDSVLAAFCSPSPQLYESDEDHMPNDEEKASRELSDCALSSTTTDSTVEHIQEDVELTEFAADMKLLLGRGVDARSCITALGWMDSCDEQVTLRPDCSAAYDSDTMDFNFDFSSSPKKEGMIMLQSELTQCRGDLRKFKLELDYEGIIVAWESQGFSPWIGGERPQLSLDDCCADFMWMWGGSLENGVVAHGEMVAGHAAMAADCGREARVRRYKEKRRTRLFSKKIRYEVRKLNAEKRPRMKGRFVKRTAPVVPAVLSAGFSY